MDGSNDVVMLKHSNQHAQLILLLKISKVAVLQTISLADISLDLFYTFDKEQRHLIMHRDSFDVGR
jgi:hypothetical protein